MEKEKSRLEAKWLGWCFRLKCAGYVQTRLVANTTRVVSAGHVAVGCGRCGGGMVLNSQIERWMEKILDEAGDARPSFERFMLLLRAQRNVKTAPIHTYLRRLFGFLRWTRQKKRSIESWDADLVTQYIGRFDNPNTRSNYARTIKLFMVMLEYGDADKIKVPPTPKRKLPKILKDRQVERLAAACDRARDRALILLTWESTKRNHEIRNLKVGDVEFDDYGALVLFQSTKSNDSRQRITRASSALQRWLQQHKDRENPDAYVFYAKKSPMTEQRFRQIVKEAAKKAGIDRRLWPHLLRHTGTAYYKERPSIYGDDDIMNITGHSDRRQLDIYGEITNARTNEKKLIEAGLVKVEEKEKNGIRKCPRCGYVNGPLDRYCSRCMMLLDVKALTRRDEIHRRVDVSMNIRGGEDFWWDVTENVYRKLNEIAEQTERRLKG